MGIEQSWTMNTNFVFFICAFANLNCTDVVKTLDLILGRPRPMVTTD